MAEFLATYWSHSGKKPARSFSSVIWCTTIRAVTCASADKPHSEEDEDQGKEHSRPCEWQEGARSILMWHGELQGQHRKLWESTQTLASSCSGKIAGLRVWISQHQQWIKPQKFLALVIHMKVSQVMSTLIVGLSGRVMLTCKGDTLVPHRRNVLEQSSDT